MSETCSITENGLPCPRPVVCHWHGASGMTLLCGHHLNALIAGKEAQAQERQPAKRGPYRKQDMGGTI